MMQCPWGSKRHLTAPHNALNWQPELIDQISRHFNQQPGLTPALSPAAVAVTHSVERHNACRNPTSLQESEPDNMPRTSSIETGLMMPIAKPTGTNLASLRKYSALLSCRSPGCDSLRKYCQPLQHSRHRYSANQLDHRLELRPQRDHDWAAGQRQHLVQPGPAKKIDQDDGKRGQHALDGSQYNLLLI
jgi:hypothetical protein